MNNRVRIDTLEITEIDFELYKEKIVPEYYKSIQKNKKEFKDFFDDMFDFYLFCSFLVDEKLLHHFKKPIYGALWFLFKRSSITFLGITRLIENGIVSEVYSLTRSLFENYLTLKILFEKEYEERAKLFMNFEWIKKKKKLEKNPDVFNQIDTYNIEMNYKKFKDNYNIEKPFPDNFDWTYKIYKDKDKKKTSIFSWCEHFGLIKDYERDYRLYSQFVHPSSVIANKIPFCPKYDKKIYSTGAISIFYFVDIISQILKFIDEKKFENYINILNKKVLNFGKKYPELSRLFKEYSQNKKIGKKMKGGDNAIR